MRRVFELRPRLATTLVATISVLIFFFFPCSKKFSVVYFSHRRAARINKKYLRQLLRVPRGVRNFVLAWTGHALDMDINRTWINTV